MIRSGRAVPATVLIVLLIVSTAAVVVASTTGSGTDSTIAGGLNNQADGDYSSVGGGRENIASGVAATIGGGIGNQATSIQATILGGFGNMASSQSSTIGGGANNVASGRHSTVPGGLQNRAAGEYSFAAGRQAIANHRGTFVWADSSIQRGFGTVDPDTFLIRAAGGVGIGTNNPGAPLHVHTPGNQVRLRLTTVGSWPADLKQSSSSVLTLSNGGAERLAIEAGGDVGIGTTSPNERLVVNAQGSLTRMAIDSASATGNVGIRLRQSGTSRWSLAALGADGDLQIYEDDAGINRLIVKGSGPTQGNVGVGTSSPADRFHIHEGNIRLTRGASWPLILQQDAASVFTIENGGAVGFVLEPQGWIAAGRPRPLASGEHNWGHVCWYPRFPPGAEVNQGWYLSTCGSAKEYVPSADRGRGYPEAGDLVSIAPEADNPSGDPDASFVVAKSDEPCDRQLLGFIAGGGADGTRRNEHYLPLAIYGYFPVKVTLENGPIAPGDPITSSSKPGYGMKATRACKIIGYALEGADQEGTIRVFATLSEYAAPEVAVLREEVADLRERVAALEQILTIDQSR